MALRGKVWKLKTVRKIKHFLWQALAGCIPVRQKLVSRHCGIDKSCPRCNTEEETINHLLFECPLAIQTWNLSNLPCEPSVFPSGGLFQKFDHLLWRIKERGAPDNSIERWPWIIWYIWKARNENLFNDKEIQPEDTTQLAHTEADTFAVAQVVDIVGETSTDQGASPHTNEDVSPIKRCQIDASWLYNGTIFWGGMVIADIDRGRTYGSCACTQVLSPLHAEFHTLLWAMKETLGYTSMTFETDCLQLTKLLEEEDIWPSVEAELEEFNYLSSTFVSFAISFIPRSCNARVARADRLSKEGRAGGSIHSIVNNVMPSCNIKRPPPGFKFPWPPSRAFNDGITRNRMQGQGSLVVSASNHVSASLQALSPYTQEERLLVFIGHGRSVKHLPEGGKVGEVVLFDPAKQKLVELKEKAIPEEIISAKGFGASKGWLFFCDPQDRCVLMSDFMNPWACKSNPKLFTLPPLTPLPSCQTDLVWNVAMFSCPDEEEEDCVVGIKSLGDQLSFCRPHRDLRWTNISTPSDYFPTSNLMYYKKDKKFYLTGPGGHHLFNREFHELKFHNFT
ncbi:unnamed protein product [Microthlaspi erraticum]|uniref:Reverse transcriptase zinc-binding domain-containing protein n=1 Tax=Microthlaspi erraticum TaxID=1685480 RepID=A0A6D2KRR6_9BRAS|nr:unnamed protein product [Microthlaspi erraticum]